MNFLLSLLKQSATQQPDNIQNTTIEITKGGLIIIGILIGIVITIGIYVLIKTLKK